MKTYGFSDDEKTKPIKAEFSNKAKVIGQKSKNDNVPTVTYARMPYALV